MTKIYLDYAAATPVDEKVIGAMSPYWAEQFFNPSAAYLPATKVRADYEAARHKIAQIIGAKPTEIIFTSGATESINLAFSQFRAQSRAVKGQAVITTAIEHPAVLEAAKAAQGLILGVDPQGRLNLDDLAQKITDQTQLVSVGYANNEIGTVQNIKGIAEICHQKRLERAQRGVDRPLVLHSDASQAAGYLDLNVARLGVDLMTLNSAKCYGPKGVGLLYVRTGTELTPLIYGGGQERGLRSGTENVSGVIGFAKAMELADKKRASEVKRLEALRQNLLEYIIYDIKNSIIHQSKKHHLPNILNFSVPGLDGERAVYALDQRGICLATGSACAASKAGTSHVLLALGLSEREAHGSLRISLGRPTTAQEIEQLKPILAEVIAREQQISY